MLQCGQMTVIVPAVQYFAVAQAGFPNLQIMVLARGKLPGTSSAIDPLFLIPPAGIDIVVMDRAGLCRHRGQQSGSKQDGHSYLNQ